LIIIRKGEKRILAFFKGVMHKPAADYLTFFLDFESLRNLAKSPEISASFLARLQRLICASRFLASEKVGHDSE
jgi:hypothetical protein